MKKICGIPSINIVAVFSLLFLFLYPPTPSFAATPVVVGTTSSYGVLAATTITNTGTTTISGTAGNDVGNSPGTTYSGFGSVTMTDGTVHMNDTEAQNAQLALTTAYDDVSLRGPATTIASDLAGDTLTAGVYTTADTTFLNTGTLTLDGGGDPNAMFFFKAASTLTTADSVASQMRLINQAQACNVYWQIGSSATLGTYSTFIGHLYAQVSITAKTGAQITGQLLARTGAVTLDTNTISNPSCNHTVTFNINTGTSGTTAAQTVNTPTALTANGFSKTGYTFAGWNTEASGAGTAYANSASYSFAADLTLYAQWTVLPPVNHTVTFDGNGASGGTTASQTANVATPLTPNGFNRFGFYFSGWNTNAAGGGTAFLDSASYSFAADLTLYAQWVPVPAVLHTVTFIGNGATGGTTASQSTNIATPLRLNGFTRTGYIFEDWNTLSDLSGVDYPNGATYSFAQDLTLYAEWSLIPVIPHTVTYNGNGSTGGTVPLDAMSPYDTGDLVTVLGNSGSLVKTGYLFVGWNTAANGTSTSHPAGSTYSIDYDTILYAQWIPTPIPLATLHVIKTVVNDDGGTAVPSDFRLHVRYRGIEVPGSPAIGMGDAGRTYVLPAGSYLVSEDPVAGYYGYFSGIGISNGLVTLTPGSDVTITRTNNDIAQAYVATPEPTASPIPPIPTTSSTISGGKLPKTSSPWYNLLGFGTIFVLVGGVGLVARRRRI